MCVKISNPPHVLCFVEVGVRVDRQSIGTQAHFQCAPRPEMRDNDDDQTFGEACGETMRP